MMGRWELCSWPEAWSLVINLVGHSYCPGMLYVMPLQLLPCATTVGNMNITCIKNYLFLLHSPWLPDEAAYLIHTPKAWSTKGRPNLKFPFLPLLPCPSLLFLKKFTEGRSHRCKYHLVPALKKFRVWLERPVNKDKPFQHNAINIMTKPSPICNSAQEHREGISSWHCCFGGFWRIRGGHWLSGVLGIGKSTHRCKGELLILVMMWHLGWGRQKGTEEMRPKSWTGANTNCLLSEW